MNQILFVVTGARQWTLADGTAHPTGFWAEELVAPYEAFSRAGHQVVIATPGGVRPVVDQGSLAPDANGGEEEATRLKTFIDELEQLRHPVSLADVDLDDFDAVFYPGGHGPMEDLSHDSQSAALLSRHAGVRQAARHRLPRTGRLAGHRGRGRLAVRRLLADRVHQRGGEAGGSGRRRTVAAPGSAGRARC